MLLFLLIALAISVTVFVYAVGTAIVERGEKIDRRLERFLHRDVDQIEEMQPDEPFWQRVVAPFLATVARGVVRITPVGWRQALRRKLVLAGNPGGLQTDQFLVLYILVIILIPLLLLLVTGGGGERRFLLVGVGTGLGLLLPDFFLKRRITQRQTAIRKALPDVLDLLTVSVEAGLGFDAALAKVVSKMSGPLPEEFSRVLQEIRMGKPRRDALKDLGARTAVNELAGFVSALVQADQLGVSVGKVLRVQSREMRRVRRQRAEEAAMKAPIKMLFPLVLFIFPSLFIVLLGPALIQMLETFGRLNR